jgi:membrane protein
MATKTPWVTGDSWARTSPEKKGRSRRRPSGRELLLVLKNTVHDWSAHNASRLAASLACYTLLSIAPLVVLSVAIAGLAFGEQAARGEIAGEIGKVVGPSAAQAIQAVVVNAKEPTSGLVSTVVGLTVLLFGASGVFTELQSALNTIWGVTPKPGRGLRGIVRDRFLSFAMVLTVAFLLLVSLVVSAALAATGKFFEHYLPGGDAVWQVLNFLVSALVAAFVFALIFEVVPDVKVPWRDVAPGALVTSLLFSAGKFALSLYIGRSSVTSSYGAAGSLVALVIWVYYSSQIVFLGAEFTQTWARRIGGEVRPSDNAIAVDPGSIK